MEDARRQLTPMQQLALGGEGVSTGVPPVVSESLVHAGEGGAAPYPIQDGAPPPGEGTTIPPRGVDPAARDRAIAEATGGAFTPPPAVAAAPEGDGGALGQDPVDQAAKAESNRLRTQAASGSLASAKDLLLGYGSQTLAKQTLDSLMQDPNIAAMFTPADEAAFLASISDNPDTSTSTLARLGRSQRERSGAQDEQFNDANLFYSGARAKALGDQSYGFQTETADAKSQIDSALGNVMKSYTAALDAARAGDLAGYQQAYDRALQEALQYGTGVDPTVKTTTGGTSSTATSPTSSTKNATPKTTVAPKASKQPASTANAAALRALAIRSQAMNKTNNLPKQTVKKRKATPVYGGHH
jgi:hypothetical protein